MTRPLPTNSGRIVFVALFPNDTRDMDESDEQQRKPHRGRSEEQSPDHPDSRRVADQRAIRRAPEQGADKFRRDQRYQAGKNPAEHRHRERTPDDIDEVAKKAHGAGLTSLLGIVVGKHLPIVGFQDIKHKPIRRKISAIKLLKRCLQVRRHIGHGDTTQSSTDGSPRHSNSPPQRRRYVRIGTSISHDLDEVLRGEAESRQD